MGRNCVQTRILVITSDPEINSDPDGSATRIYVIVIIIWLLVNNFTTNKWDHMCVLVSLGKVIQYICERTVGSVVSGAHRLILFSDQRIQSSNHLLLLSRQMDVHPNYIIFSCIILIAWLAGTSL